jgi:ankyrin
MSDNSGLVLHGVDNMVFAKRVFLLVLLMLCSATMTGAPLAASELTDALKARDVAQVRSLLAAGADVNEKFRGDYPINIAALFGPTELVAALLDAGAGLEQQGRDGFYPLHNAVASGHSETVALLIKRGAVVDAKEGRGRTPLLYFAATGGSNNEIARMLLAAGADPGSMDVDLNSALQHAALTNNPGLAELLISAHADLNHQSLRGETALHIAAHHLHSEIAKALIAAGAGLNLKMVSGLTPLGDTDDQAMRQLLIEAGAK